MRRTASEIIRELEGRIARLERQASARLIYSPNDMFEVEKGNGYIRFYLGGKFNTRTIFKDIDSTFYKAMEYEFTNENSIPSEYLIEECIEEAFDNTEIIEELSRTRKGERAIQVNLFKKDEFVKNAVKELEGDMEDLKNYGLEYILDWSDEYVADKAFKAGVKALMEKYGDVRTNRINPKTYRLASTRKVAGHIVLAGTVNVRQLRRDLEDTFGIEDIEIEDGVLTFLMSTMDNKQIEKQVKALAKKHDVKFEKGEFTDGLGMIYTKNASRRNRRASKPMFNLVLIKETLEYDEDTSVTLAPEEKELFSKKFYSFEDLLKELKSNRIFYGWSWERNGVSYKGNKLSITSSYEEVMMAYAEERAVLHLNLARGVELDRAQIKMIEKALDMR